MISHAEKKMNLNFLTALNKYFVFKEWHVIIQMSIQFVCQREQFFFNNYRSMYLDSSACETVGWYVDIFNSIVYLFLYFFLKYEIDCNSCRNWQDSINLSYPVKKNPDPVPIIMMYAQFNRSLWDEKIWYIIIWQEIILYRSHHAFQNS